MYGQDLNTKSTLGDCLFGAVKLTKNVHSDKYACSGYVIGFDARSQFLLPSGAWGKNIVIFGVGNSSSVHVDNSKKEILDLGEGPTNGLDDTTIMTDAKYSVNISNHRNKICLSLHYSAANNFLYGNCVKFHQFKAKYSEIKKY